MNQTVFFVTGNPNKAAYASEQLGREINHIHLELEEIQSLNLHEIVSHKCQQAYKIVKQPVIVEDVSLEIDSLNGLPGPFVKFFLERMSLELFCNIIPAFASRQATARTVIGFFDGTDMQLFEGVLPGSIAQSPSGSRGFGWDGIFIPQGYASTRAALSPEDDLKTYSILKPFDQVKTFLHSKKM